MWRYDFCALNDQDAMDGLVHVLRQRYELKITGRLCMDNDGSQSEVIFFNRVLRIVHSVNRPSFEIEGDPRRAEIIVSEELISETHTVDTSEHREGTESQAGSRLLVSPFFLTGEDTTRYRSVTMHAGS